jgi:hypothetical protein
MLGQRIRPRLIYLDTHIGADDQIKRRSIFPRIGHRS